MNATADTADCLLCNRPSKLELSHIVPAFVFRWLRESSGNGHLRTNREPNLRVQDGPKEHWLCGSCEDNFGRSETAFANQIFYPYLRGPQARLAYGSWLLHFCTSVSWRTLRYHMSQKAADKFSDSHGSNIARAEETWRKYLLGQLPHPGEFRQHLLPMDQIEDTSADLSPNINRYLMRAVQIDLCGSDKTLFTFTKLGRFMVLGFVSEPNPNRWVGARVNANRGTVEPRTYKLPHAFLGYINDKANSMGEVTKELSARQREKIDSAFLSNIDRIAGSDFFTAMSADVEMFGKKAFHDNQ